MTMHRRRAVLPLLALALAAIACGRGGARSELTLAGSTSVQPFAEKWAEAYRKGHPGVSIHVQGGGSTAGVQAALSGAAQVGMSSRELKPDEKKQLHETVVARDGIAIVVHKSSPLTSLDLASARDIYAGKLTSWKDAGGKDGKITVITREEGSGTRGAFEDLVMKGAKIAPSSLVQDSTGAVRQMVSSDPAAIGYISLGQVDASVKALSIAGAEANEANIDAGKYPLVRPFLFVTKGEPQGDAATFLAWIKGPEGAALTRQEGLLPPRK
jgi:phosphate transport system substrate-binding protein